MLRLTNDRFERLVDLRGWLRGLGCCPLCRISMAWAQMWREYVDPSYKLGVTGCTDRKQPDCFEVAKAHWRSMPARKP